MNDQKFGKLTVVERAPKSGPHIQWICICECGGKSVTRGTHLRNGRTTMCLACAIKLGNEANTKHGAYGTPEYQAWQSMIQRCTNPTNRNFHRYGARGITVCDEWRNNFECFFADMGNRPADNYSLDRIRNNEGYSKRNCHWATDVEQARNRRSNKFITHNGRTLLLIEWANELQTRGTSILQMLKRGKTMAQVIDFYSHLLDHAPKVKARRDEVAKLLLA